MKLSSNTPFVLLAFGAWALGLASTAAAQEPTVTIDKDASVFAVITHKAGPAAKFAHNHLVVAGAYDVELSLDPDAPAQASFRLSTTAQDLVVDDPGLQEAWYPRLAELGILNEPFAEISDKDRGKIRKSMLSKKQLNAEATPTLAVTLLSISKTESGEEHPFQLKLKMDVAGRSAEPIVKAKMRQENSRVIVEAVAELSFTDFGIEPYSAMLGAVRNQDLFHLFLHLEGTLPTAP